MEKILSIARWRDVPDEECLGWFDAVCAPVDAWRKGPDCVERRQGYAEARFRTEHEAARAGVEAGRQCRSLGLEAFNVGGWKRWAGVEGERPVKDPYANMEVFVSAFRIAAPSTAKLVYKGISSSYTSQPPALIRLHDPALMAQFDRVCIANFGTDPELVREWYIRRTFKYQHVVECIPEFGVGRIDANGDMWGHWETTHKLLLDTNPSAVSFSFAKGSRLQMRVGHAYHPPLSQCVKELETNAS